MLFIDEKFFVLFRTKSRELPLEVGEDGTLIPNFLVQLNRFLLQRLSVDDFVRNLKRSRKLILEADKFVRESDVRSPSLMNSLNFSPLETDTTRSWYLSHRTGGLLEGSKRPRGEKGHTLTAGIILFPPASRFVHANMGAGAANRSRHPQIPQHEPTPSQLALL